MAKDNSAEWAKAADLIAPAEGEKEITLKTLKKKVCIKKVNVGEIAAIMKHSKESEMDQFVYLVFKGLVRPKLTIDQAKKLPLKVIIEISAAVAKFSELDKDSVEGIRNLLETKF